MSPDIARVFQDMATAPLRRFRDWERLEATLPSQPGVYTIWHGAMLLYAGKATGQRGLRGRLRTHASGNHVSSDFCRLAWGKQLLPMLTPAERLALDASQRSIPDLIRRHMHRSNSFRIAVTQSDALAARAETLLRQGALRRGRTTLLPTLNPLSRGAGVREGDRHDDPGPGDAEPAPTSDPVRVWNIVQAYRAAREARRSMLPASQEAVKANLAVLTHAPATRAALERVGVEKVVAAVTTRGRPKWLADLRADQGKPGHYGRSESTAVNGVALAAVWAASRQAGE